MPKVEGTYAHSMSQEDATTVVRNAIAELLSSFEATDVEVVDDGKDNLGFSCKSRGFTISGKVVVRDNEVQATINLPMLAMAFKGLVKEAMDAQIPKYLAG